jgi:hypothetical protein
MSTSPTIAVNIRFEPYDVYIGRPGKGQDGYYGNPHHGPNHDENIVRFEDYFHARLKNDPEYRCVERERPCIGIELSQEHCETAYVKMSTS